MVETTLISPESTQSILSWPLPPFFRATEQPAVGQSRACCIEMMNGTTLLATLHSLDASHGSISVSTAAHAALRSLDLKDVRTIRLTSRLSLLPDVEVRSKVTAAAAHGPEAREFAVNFQDGKIFSGTTCGFVKTKAGLFLYLPVDKTQHAIRCFVPAQHVLDVRIGPLLGDVLTANNVISSTTLDAALEKQAALRRQKLGEHLLETGIVTQEDLKRALLSQKLNPTMKLGELLLGTGAITRSQLKAALAAQSANRRRSLGDTLVEMGMITMRQVQTAVAKSLGIPFVDVREFRIDPLALQSLSAGVSKRYQALPLAQVGDSVVVAVENPLAVDFAHDLRVFTGRSIVPVIADPQDLRRRIAREYSTLDHAAPSASADLLADSTEVADFANALTDDEPASPETKASEADLRVTDNALVRLVNKIIIDASAQGASDIHIESGAGRSNTRIRFRKDGELEDYFELPSSYSSALVSRIKIMANLDISERRHAQDGKITFGRNGRVPIELRVAIVPTTNHMENVVLRILGGVEPLPIQKLGLCARDLGELQRMISRSYGLILACGPTGSGKTTTLHSILHHINRPDIKIWTAEDPVEITQAGLCQVQINADIGWTFAAAMRAFLRADPDVIMVGEMRDGETAKIAIEASLTGHLVFSTLHTNSAAESVVRLLDLGMDPFNFADALIGILSQRLARMLCSKCKSARAASDGEITELLEEYCAGSKLETAAVLAQWRADYAGGGPLLLHEAVGCKACREGYQGRMGIYELLSGTAEVKQLARSHGTLPQIVAAARTGGMRLLCQDAIEKVLLGLIDRPSARAVSS